MARSYRNSDQSVPPPHSKELKAYTTCAVLFGNITFGCAFNFFSPSLEELRNKYNTTVDEISVIFTIIGISFCAGALATGFVYNFINRQLGSIICLGGISLAIIFAPHCPSITILFINCAILGFFVGAYDTTQMVWMIEIWQSKCGPFIQAQNFCYALGSNIPPLLLAPFLPNEQRHLSVSAADLENSTNFLNISEIENDPDTSILNRFSTPSVEIFNETVVLRSFSTQSVEFDMEDVFLNTTTTPSSDLHEVSIIYIPFAIAGFLNFLSMSGQIYLFIFHRYYTPPLEEEIIDTDDCPDAFFLTQSEKRSKRRGSTISNYSLNHRQRAIIFKSQNEYLNQDDDAPKTYFNWPKCRLVMVAALFLGAYCGMEISSIQFIPTFAQYGDLKLSEANSAFVLTGLTAAYATGRAFGICIVMKVPPFLMLIGNFTLVILGNFILLLFANSNYAMLWTGCIILGAGFSTIYASFCAFIERHLLFTNEIGSCMLVTISIFASVYPLVVGRFVAKNAMILTYTNFFSIGVCVLALSTAYFMTYKNTSRVG